MSRTVPQKSPFLQTLWNHRFIFLVVFTGAFALSFVFLAVIGLVPEELKPAGDTNLVSFINAQGGDNIGVDVIPNVLTSMPGEEPVRLVIEKINVDQPVLNPSTRDVNVLDNYLTKGVVRYPGSGLLGAGNAFFFGHSSTLPVIRNQAYKALNHLDYLAPGDMVKVYSTTKVYTYKIISVTKKNEGQALIDLSSKQNKITISTCDTFSGIKQQRIIVEGDLISATKL